MFRSSVALQSNDCIDRNSCKYCSGRHTQQGYIQPANMMKNLITADFIGIIVFMAFKHASSEAEGNCVCVCEWPNCDLEQVIKLCVCVTVCLHDGFPEE